MKGRRRVVLHEPLGSGGICHYTFQLAEGLASAGADVAVLTTRNYELAERRRHFELLDHLSESRFMALLRRLLRRTRPNPEAGAPRVADAASAIERGGSGRGWLESLRYAVIWCEVAAGMLIRRTDVVHVQWLTRVAMDMRFLRILRWCLRFKLVYTAHNILPHGGATTDDRELLARVYRGVDLVIVHGEENREQLAREFGIREERIRVLPHGAFDLFMESGRPTKCDARHALGIPEDRIVLLFFGGIRRYKGFEYLVDAFRHLRAEEPRLHLLVAGEIATSSHDEHAYYSRYLDRLRGLPGLTFRDGYVPMEEVSTIFAASDLVVLPYVKTYQSGVVPLAYAAGRPVVVTDTGALAESVDPGKTGLVVPTKDADALADAIRTLVRDPDSLARMGEAACRFAEERLSWSAIARRTLDAYGGPGA